MSIRVFSWSLSSLSRLFLRCLFIDAENMTSGSHNCWELRHFADAKLICFVSASEKLSGAVCTGVKGYERYIYIRI